MTINTPEMPKGDELGIVGLASTYSAETLISPHAHTAHQIVHAISGTMRISVQDSVWFIPPGHAMWIPAGTGHSIQCVGQVEMRTAYLSEAYPSVQTSIVVVAVSPLMREILVRMADDDDKGLKLLLADVLINEIKQGAVQPLCLPVPSDPRIAKLALHLQNQPADQTTLKTWAKQLGYSERNLIRNIRAETGMTFRELRRLTRIMVSLDRLSVGQSVTETAFDVGFETPSAFIYAFRHLLGSTPRQFMSKG
jgi:AraC-like DNA-binding protein